MRQTVVQKRKKAWSWGRHGGGDRVGLGLGLEFTVQPSCEVNAHRDLTRPFQAALLLHQGNLYTRLLISERRWQRPRGSLAIWQLPSMCMWRGKGEREV